jgi:hypothetical protein
MECFYGCGKEAKFFFKNGRGCCEESPNKCESKRGKDSEKKKGSFKGTPAWKIEGYVFKGWSKGLTKEDNPNMARPNQKGIRFGASLNGHTQETKDKLSKIAVDRKLGGYVQGSGRGKKTWYESKIAGNVFLDSSYELRYAKYLDNNNIPWIKNNKKFPYYDENNRLRNYIPDFYLLETEDYIEIKGYKTIRDEYKWNQFPHTLKVLFNEDLIKLEE